LATLLAFWGTSSFFHVKPIYNGGGMFAPQRHTVLGYRDSFFAACSFFLEILLIPSFVTGPLFSHGACFARSGRKRDGPGGREAVLSFNEICAAASFWFFFWLEIETFERRASERARDFFFRSSTFTFPAPPSSLSLFSFPFMMS